MSNVNLDIGGRSYTIATSAGDEERIRKLGALIDDKVRELGAMAGQSEARQLMFAALLLADDLEQARGKAPQATAPATTTQSDPKIADALEAVAARLEGAAAALEKGG